jgi:hypothetical protein
MTHFAEIDENNIVIRVLSIEQEVIDSGEWGNPENWIQTSYNTNAGIYHIHDTHTPSEDQTKALRKNFAGKGFSYDSVLDAFIAPKPYDSWILNETTCIWEPPIEQPVVNDDQMAMWDEGLLDWVIYGNV